MTWIEITALNNAGNEIGGHTVTTYNLKGCTDQQTCINEVCQDRQNLISHGFYPATSPTLRAPTTRTRKASCRAAGTPRARAAGGIDVSGRAAGRCMRRPSRPRTCSRSGRSTTHRPGTRRTYRRSAFPHAGRGQRRGRRTAAAGSSISFHQICDQTLDPANYSSCISRLGTDGTRTLNALLDWLQNAGQPGGAPAGTVVKTMTQVLNGS